LPAIIEEYLDMTVHLVHYNSLEKPFVAILIHFNDLLSLFGLCMKSSRFTIVYII